MKSELSIYSKGFAGANDYKFWFSYIVNGVSIASGFCDSYDINGDMFSFYMTTELNGGFVEIRLNKDTKILEDLEL